MFALNANNKEAAQGLYPHIEMVLRERSVDGIGEQQWIPLARCAELRVLHDFIVVWQSMVKKASCEESRFQVCCERCYLAWATDSDARRRLVANWVACLAACKNKRGKCGLKFAKRCLNITRAQQQEEKQQDILYWLASHAMWQAHTVIVELADRSSIQAAPVIVDALAHWQLETATYGSKAGIYKKNTI